MKSWSDGRCAWLGLYFVPGLGNVGAKNLLREFGSPEAVFEASVSELSQIEGVRQAAARSIARREFACDPERELKRLDGYGGRLLTYFDPCYPPGLRQIHDPPVLLYMMGKDIPVDSLFVSVVGSRNATHYGLHAAERIANGLAKRGAGVVSGMARGVDSAAHLGCLRGGGYTIAVMGTGINVIYPGSNKRLYREIAENGAVLSEFPLDTPPEPRNFPIRNRIISGISNGVVVVEATKGSGSLITAAFALEQGRDVFAVPGSVDSFKSRGTHFLIKQGASLVENADDVLDELGFDDKLNYADGLKEPSPQIEMDESEKKIYEVVGDYPIHIDEILRLVHLEPGAVSGILVRMELKGILKQLPGKMFVR